MTPGPTTKMERSMARGDGGGGGGGGGSSGTEERKRCGETIHSGQFMVSHFETEGAEDDDDDLGMQMEDVKPSDLIAADSAVGLPTATGVSADVCAAGAGALVPLAASSTSEQNQLARYVPRPLHLSSRSAVSQVEIDTDLSTVFNTLNVTYTQKLTSPKWNPFKGIRLRWKEKIRLNNVIWRCWHMQWPYRGGAPGSTGWGGRVHHRYRLMMDEHRASNQRRKMAHEARFKSINSPTGNGSGGGGDG
uniref:Uncharacterized protein n=1 Tax=Anopheles atroparvus TaxID=41427 RepID=A0A182IZ86_ANOAO